MKQILLGVFGGLWYVGAHSALASNGTNLVGSSAASLALGGVSVSRFLGHADAVQRNPSLLLEASEADGQWGGDVHFNFIKHSATAQKDTLGEKTSAYPIRFAPALAIARRQNQNYVWAIGIVPSGGGGADYTGNAADLNDLKVDFTHVRVLAGSAFRLGESFSLGLSAFASYGELMINENLETGGAPTGRAPHGAIGGGVVIGANYKISDSVCVGTAFQWESPITYKSVVDLEAFKFPIVPDGADDVKVQQPMEFALGLTVDVVEDMKLSAEYRYIGWGSAAGYKELGWSAQHVAALGAEYRVGDLHLRAGFNYGGSPIASTSGEDGTVTSDFQGHTVMARFLSVLNGVGFPATVTTNVSFGAAYEISPDLTAELGASIAPSVLTSRAGTFVGPSTYTYAGSVSQWTIAGGAKFRL